MRRPSLASMRARSGRDYMEGVDVVDEDDIDVEEDFGFVLKLTCSMEVGIMGRKGGDPF
jgi:hypothetical protein